MRITITGANGRIGAHLTRLLLARGHHVVAASPGTGVDTVTGDGLSTAVARADVVVDVTDAPSFADAAVMDFFQTSGRNLLAAELAAQVRHHVALSVVGADRLPGSAYMRAKAAQEQLVGHGLVPYTVVRSTQSFECLDTIGHAGRDGRAIRLSPVLMQPIAAADVATILADVAEADACDGRVDIAGPERLRQDEVVRRLLAARHDTRTVLTDPAVYYFGAAADDTTLVPARPWRLGGTRFSDWLSAQAVAACAARTR
ncbi:SDR family oxidoreductase [Catellatospora sp. NPDC049609]|uniref:SDR family oxidoreductase n=1 Tax=Catellatospora sp. NPDC049609 TaxID=3155505 RepID=UPI00342D6A48